MSTRKKASPKLDATLKRIRDLINDGTFRYGTLLPAERSLSEEFGINRQTLRKALTQLNEEKVIRHEKGIGHRIIAEHLKPVAQAKEKIAVLFYRPADYIQIDGYYGGIFSEIVKQADEKYDLLTQLLSARKPLEEIEDIIKTENIKGIITLGVMAPTLFTDLATLDTPIVSIDYDATKLGFDSIVDNDFDAAKQATNLLIQLGHTQIAYMGIKRGSETVGFEEEASSSQRLLGYQQVMEKHKLTPTSIVTRSGLEGGKSGYAELISKNPKLTGIVCFHDDMVIGAMRSAKETGKVVPKDLSLIGFGDDARINQYIEQAITTIRAESFSVMAEIALHHLNARLKNKKSEPVKTFMNAELIVRDTTAQCPQS